MSEPDKSVSFHVTGRVQGVSFRAWTEHEARRLGLAGWVRNREDGGVEGVAAGPESAVDALMERLREGPRAARVDDVRVSAADETPTERFEVRR